MASLDWINSALQGLLPTLWMSLGLGLPWAYVILSTKQWHARATIGALALAVGPAWMTAWMLVLGVIGAQLNQRLFTPQWILSGSIIIALLGVILAWRKRKHVPPHSTNKNPFATDEKLIIGMIVIAVIIRWVHTVFWTFTAYDALWVYGYQGRLYFLEGFIPNSIDYYPQFLQLQYTYVQVLIGAIDDHAARMVIPMLHIGSILASYVLGQRIFNRRIGIYVAALWSLHPYVGHWSVIGDLEIPVTFSFTMAAAFFISAWMEKGDAQLRRNSAWIAGLMLSIAMYTKPTAGAFIWGVMLLVVIELLRTRFNLRQWQTRFMVAFWTGLASIPLGAVWYVRNVVLGHDAITFPPSVWLTLARRSGDHFNWIILVVIVGFLVYSLRYKIPLHRFVLGLIGISLLLLGVLPSNPLISPTRFDPPMSYMSLLEVSLSTLGLGMVGFSVLPYIRTKILRHPSYNIRVIGWSLALALPYFITWFYSYSYHYRLGFAIVPLMILPTAFLTSWFTPERMARWGNGLRWGYYLLLFALGLPGILAVTVDITWTRIWLADETLDSDRRKYQVFNPSLMEVTFALNEYIETTGNSPVVVAPGEQRLHFFFPQIQVIDQLVTTLDEFDALQPTHYIYGAQGREQYTRAGIDHTQTQLVSALGREDIFQLVKSHDDATFSYELYEYSGNRFDFQHDDYRYDLRSQDVFFGDYIRLHGVNIITQNHLYKGTEIRFETLWQTLKDLPQNYEVVIEFDHRNWWKVDYYWVQQFARHEYGHYASNMWDVREFVQDDRTVALPDSDLLASGQRYTFNIALLDTTNNQFLPVFVDGEYVGEFYKIQDEYGYK